MALAACVLFVVTAGPASAHVIGGVNPTNYQSRLFSVDPPVAGVKLRLLDLGRRVQVSNTTRVDLTVLGYSGEPYLRVGGSGVYENVRSPSLYLNQVLPSGIQPTVPATASASAPPEWRRRSGGHTVSWHDHRTRWAGADPAVVREDPGVAHIVIPSWTVTMSWSDQTIAATGDVVYIPGSSAAPWLVLAVAVGALVFAAARSRWWRPALSAALAVLIAVDVVQAWAMASAGQGSVGSEIGRFAAASFLPAVGWIVGAASMGPLERGSDVGLLGAALTGLIVGLYSGVGDITALWRSQLPATVAPVAVRLGVALSLGLGAGLLSGAVARTRRLARNGRAIRVAGGGPGAPRGPAPA